VQETYTQTIYHWSAATYDTQLENGWQLVWRRGNGVRHINEVKLRRARLVLELVTTFGGSTISVFIQATQAHSAWPSLRGIGSMSTGDGFGHL